MEMSVIPPLDGVLVVTKAVEYRVHSFAFVVCIPNKFRIHFGPGLQPLFVLQFTERRSGMSNDRIDGASCRDEVNRILVIYRCLVWPPNSRLQMSYSPSTGVLFLAPIAVDADGPAYAEDVVITGLDDGIVRDAPPALVGDLLLGEIGRIIMVAMNEYDPVVCLPKPARHLVIDGLIVARLLKAEAAVTGDNKKGVFQTVLDAQLEDNTSEVTVYIAGDKDGLGVRIVEYLVHFSAFLIWFSIISFTCRNDTGL